MLFLFLCLLLFMGYETSYSSDRNYFPQDYTLNTDGLNISRLVIKTREFQISDTLIQYFNENSKEVKSYFDFNHNYESSISIGERQSSVTELLKYWILVLDTSDISKAISIAYYLNLSAEIHIAYFEPFPVKPPTETPDFSEMQTYLNPAPIGMAYEEVKNIAGATGAGVSYCDVEYSVIEGHEDYDDSKFSYINPNGSFPNKTWEDHGAATLGLLCGIRDDKGINGMAPESKVYIAYPCHAIDCSNYSVANAIKNAADELEYGDILLIEQQTSLPYPQSLKLGQVSYYDANYDAIKYATDKGIIVIEPGGNGGINLDTNFLNGRFDRNLRDCGSILVAAANLNNLRRYSFSPYGSRIDLFSAGGAITTSGYGALFTDKNSGNRRDYTNNYGGTSGASALCAAAVTSLQGIYYELSGNKLGPNEMRELLYETGTNSNSPPSENIGRMIDLGKAYHKIYDNHTDVSEDSENHFAEITFVSLPNNIVEIKGLNKVFKNPEVYIYDIRGRLVKRFDRLNSDRLDLNSIDIGRGIYFIKSGYSIGKLIKY